MQKACRDLARSTLARYLLWQAPGWTLAAGVAWTATSWLGLPAWLAILGVALVIVKDIALYPPMRAVFRAPASPRYIGAVAQTVESLSPSGYVRIHGELWRAEVTGDHVSAGTDVVIREARGLTLLVEPLRRPERPTEVG